MKLITAIEGSGIRIGALKDVNTARIEDVPYFEIRSEDYLREIDITAESAGGWTNINQMVTSVKGESFTSLRGLVTLINALSSVHNIPVFVFNDELATIERRKVPLSPQYASEPNITTCV